MYDVSTSPGGVTVIHSPHRTGCMAAFESFQKFESYFDEILDLLEDYTSPAVISPKIIEALESASESRMSTSINVSLSLDHRDSLRPTDEHIQVNFFLVFSH